MAEPRASTPEQHRRAIVLLALCGVFWSTAGVLIKFVDWNAIAIWSMRSAIAALAIYALRRPSLRGITKAEWHAAIALCFTTGLFILANKLTTAANAILIQYSAPVWVALLGRWFLGERARWLDWLTIAFVLGGIALFFFDDITLDHATGNLLALAAGVAFALSALTMRRAALSKAASGEAIDPLRPLYLGNLLGAVIGVPAWFIGSPPDAEGWLALVALGVVQQAIAYLCYAAAIRHATALEAMLIPVIEPILSPLLVAATFGEWPTGLALVGGAIVVGAVTLRAVVGARLGRATPPPPAAST